MVNRSTHRLDWGVPGAAVLCSRENWGTTCPAASCHYRWRCDTIQWRPFSDVDACQAATACSTSGAGSNCCSTCVEVPVQKGGPKAAAGAQVRSPSRAAETRCLHKNNRRPPAALPTAATHTASSQAPLLVTREATPHNKVHGQPTRDKTKPRPPTISRGRPRDGCAGIVREQGYHPVPPSVVGAPSRDRKQCVSVGVKRSNLPKLAGPTHTAALKVIKPARACAARTQATLGRHVGGWHWGRKSSTCQGSWEEQTCTAQPRWRTSGGLRCAALRWRA